MAHRPVFFSWDGDEMIPLPHSRAECDRQFVIGEVYRLDAIEERSQISHGHYFAALNDAWLNLPEGIAERFPTSEHLRKYALIKAGYHDQRSIVAGSKAEAQRIAAFIKPMDDFAVVTVSEAVVTIYTAKSQSRKAQGKKDFQESKQAVLEIVAAMIDRTPEQLSSNARRAA